jgi:hypothetical protein
MKVQHDNKKARDRYSIPRLLFAVVLPTLTS